MAFLGSFWWKIGYFLIFPSISGLFSTRNLVTPKFSHKILLMRRSWLSSKSLMCLFGRVSHKNETKNATKNATKMQLKMSLKCHENATQLQRFIFGTVNFTQNIIKVPPISPFLAKMVSKYVIFRWKWRILTLKRLKWT